MPERTRALFRVQDARAKQEGAMLAAGVRVTRAEADAAVAGARATDAERHSEALKAQRKQLEVELFGSS